MPLAEAMASAVSGTRGVGALYAAPKRILLYDLQEDEEDEEEEPTEELNS